MTHYHDGMKYMALDYGQKRVGVAVTDAGGRMAFPRVTLPRETREAFFDALIRLIDAERPDALVLGLPLCLDGSDSLTTRQTRNFAESLKRRTPLPVYWMEEACTSLEAARDLREAGRSGRSAVAVLDQQAAVRILESFLSQPEHLRKTA